MDAFEQCSSGGYLLLGKHSEDMIFFEDKLLSSIHPRSTHKYKIGFTKSDRRSTLIQNMVRLIFLNSGFPHDLLSNVGRSHRWGVILSALVRNEPTALDFFKCKSCSAEDLSCFGLKFDLSLGEQAFRFLAETLGAFQRHRGLPTFYFKDLPLNNTDLIELDESLIQVLRLPSGCFIIAGTLELSEGLSELGVLRLFNRDRRIYAKSIDANIGKRVVSTLSNDGLIPLDHDPKALEFLVDELSRTTETFNYYKLYRTLIDVIGEGYRENRITFSTVRRVISRRPVTDEFQLNLPRELEPIRWLVFRGDVMYHSKTDTVKPLRWLNRQRFKEINYKLWRAGFRYDRGVHGWIRFRKREQID